MADNRQNFTNLNTEIGNEYGDGNIPEIDLPESPKVTTSIPEEMPARRTTRNS